MIPMNWPKIRMHLCTTDLTLDPSDQEPLHDPILSFHIYGIPSKTKCLLQCYGQVNSL